ncbi:response regulator [Streptomyces kanamyceticus]|uniref:DNA-binding response regulator n=1 Tax=Streptomyces kanamyceticus TaxID=1967 RepID=A0A5J6GS86_STRKN|nr:response regulator transcription factor [Streptomyces kanamyceticus]QEU96648.1 DNA-binding response regulator [Streptomyces kanamyceticus]
MTEPLRVLLADDQTLVRTGFRMILGADGIDVVAEATNGVEAVEAARRTRPDVVLMDVRMPEMDGLEATRRILAAPEAPRSVPEVPCSVPEAPHSVPEAPHSVRAAETPLPDAPRVLILTTFDLDRYVYAALSAGASGFLLKDVTPEQLTASVRTVRTGDALLAPAITRRLVRRFAGGEHRHGTQGGSDAAALHRDLAPLTPRELEVLGLLARGLSNAELAARLHLAEATVKTHVARILAKLGLRDRVQAVIVAYETGLISAGEHEDAQA